MFEKWAAAEAAMEGLNGMQTAGAANPLVVKFADGKAKTKPPANGSGVGMKRGSEAEASALSKRMNLGGVRSVCPPAPLSADGCRLIDVGDARAALNSCALLSPLQRLQYSFWGVMCTHCLARIHLATCCSQMMHARQCNMPPV